MSLRDLLRAAGGEVALSSAVGRWMLSVSNALASGAGTPDYGFSKRSGTAQTLVGVNTSLQIDLPGAIRGISHQSEGNWILNTGKLYLLRAIGYFDTFSDATGGSLTLKWVDDDNNPLISGGIDSPAAIFAPGTNTNAWSTAAALEMLYAVPTGAVAGRVARVRCTAATGTASLPAGSWSTMVMEIP